MSKNERARKRKGQTVGGGRYEILGRLATGGMGELLLAQQIHPPEFQRTVVIKRVLPHLAQNASFTKMIYDEARIAARIQHPNVVAIHDLFVEHELPHIVMQYLRGQALSSVLDAAAAKGEILAPSLVTFLGFEAAAGLGAAHALRDDKGQPLDVVHRDVSPHNIFVTYDGEVKIVDFSIAHASDRLSTTTTGEIKGKFRYMAPEQLLGQEVDRRADIFALGIVLWEAATGRRLFEAADVRAAVRAILEEPTPRPSEVLPDFAPALERVIMRALEHERRDRYPTAEQLQAALVDSMPGGTGLERGPEELRATMLRLFGDAVHAPPKLEAPLAVATPETGHTEAGQEQTPSIARRKRRIVPIAATLLILLAGAIAAWAVREEEASHEPARVANPAAVVRTVRAPTLDEPPERDKVQVGIETAPPGARVEIDGRMQGTTPLVFDLPRSSAPLEVVLTRTGYEARRIPLVPDSDVRLQFELSKRERTSPPRRRTRKAKRVEFPRFE